MVVTGVMSRRRSKAAASSSSLVFVARNRPIMTLTASYWASASGWENNAAAKLTQSMSRIASSQKPSSKAQSSRFLVNGPMAAPKSRVTET